MNVRKESYVFAAIILSVVAGCGGPQELSGQDKGLNRTKNPCIPTTQAQDDDGDGLSNECEDQLGFDRSKKDTDGDGIEDGSDLPPGRIEDKDQNFWQAFRDRLYQEIGAGLTMAQLGFEGPNNPIPGIEGTVVDQKLRISSQSVGSDASTKEFCESDTYLFLRFAGYFAYCNSVESTTKCGDNIPSVFEICAKDIQFNTPPEQVTKKNQKLVFSSLQWTKAKSLGKMGRFTVFDPAVLTENGKASNLSTSITVKKTDGNPAYPKEIETIWKPFPISGTLRNEDGEIVGRIKVTPEEKIKNWKHSDVVPPQGILGIFANTN